VLRFLAAFGVLCFHYQHFYAPGLWSHAVVLNRDALPLADQLGFFYSYGALSVQLFWTLSGFIFYWKYAASVYARRIRPGEFARRRFSRLYPLHLATLVLVAILQGLYLATHETTFIYGAYDVQNFFV